MVHTMGVVAVQHGQKLSLQVSDMPTVLLVKTLLPKGTGEPLDKGMENRNSRHGRARFDAQDPQVGLPAVELKQAIVIDTNPKTQP
jgi:hypothetical protein